MLKMFRYVKDKWYMLLLIVALLFLQAYCDLSLPDYTSKIVNVGIQQKGVEDGVPEEILASSMEKLFFLMDEKDADTVREHYTVAGDAYSLKKIKKETREELNRIFCEVIVKAASFMEKSESPGTDMTEGGAFGTNQPSGGMNLGANVEELPETMITQAAVLFVQHQYELLGKDLDGIQMKYILTTGGRMLLFAFLIMAAAISVTFLSSRLAAELGRNLRNSVYRKVISFSGAELNQFSTASLITRSTNDIQQVQMLTTMLFRIVLYAPILGIGGVLRVLRTDVSMTWILGLAVVLILLLIGFLFAVAMPKFKMLQTLIDKLNLVTREILSGIMVTRAFSTETHEEERFEKANHDLMKTNLFVNRCMTFMMPAMMLIMNGITVLIVWNGAHAVDAGSMQVGNMMAFIQYAMQIIMSFLMITMLSIMLPRAGVSAKRINEVLETEVSVREPEHPVSAAEDVQGLVEFDHVSFGYPDAEEQVLEDICFTARRGETVAFIGSTGSGKSTLVNLIPRFYDVTGGTIRVDGVDVRQMPLKKLREKIGYVPQKGVLFSGTIDSNLRYGCQEASEETVKKAAQVAQAWDFISEKAEGLQEPIAQGGTNVSGGQKQRLSIARAVAKQPEIFIFDDSFSALDYKTDVALRKALKKETADATTLIVAQRISTILHADQIIVLDEGRVAGQGTHKELMKNCEVYRQIAMSQLSEEELSNE